MKVTKKSWISENRNKKNHCLSAYHITGRHSVLIQRFMRWCLGFQTWCLSCRHTVALGIRTVSPQPVAYKTRRSNPLSHRASRNTERFSDIRSQPHSGTMLTFYQQKLNKKINRKEHTENSTKRHGNKQFVQCLSKSKRQKLWWAYEGEGVYMRRSPPPFHTDRFPHTRNIPLKQ